MANFLQMIANIGKTDCCSFMGDRNRTKDMERQTLNHEKTEQKLQKGKTKALKRRNKSPENGKNIRFHRGFGAFSIFRAFAFNYIFSPVKLPWNGKLWDF